MTDSTKAALCTVTGFAALVACFAIMADCSKSVARTNGEAECVAGGGVWLSSVRADNATGHCVEKARNPE